jgi:tetratricopeptide (TPR) repeat protein
MSRVSMLAAAIALGMVPCARAQTPYKPASAPRYGASPASHADSLYRAGNYAAAAEAYEPLTRSSPDSARYWAQLGISLHETGKYQGALAAYRRSLALTRSPTIVYNVAAAHARLGERDSAFAWLDSSLAAGFAQPATLDGDHDFDDVRADPRYALVIAKMRAAREPCVARAESHQFDFWVGEWNVATPAGQPAGHSVVQKILGQCVILENWTDGQGGEGKSLNAYNAQLKMWQQFWTDQYGSVTEYRESEWVGTSLRLTAHVGAAQVRMTFTPVDSNTVRQVGERSTDGGKTWAPSFDLYYHRKA